MKELCSLLSIALVGCLAAATEENPVQFGSSVASDAVSGVEYPGESEARELDFNFGWKFMQDGLLGAESPSFDDSKWRALRLPHDWSVEHSFDPNLDGATGYLPGGIGWYRKTFNLDLKENEEAYILFDGIYNHSEVFLNGKKLGYRPFGYVPFFYKLTDVLQAGSNLIAVRVDRSRYIDSRWYTGSGIYRNVKLVILDKLHVPIWGTYVTTPEVSGNHAMAHIETRIENAYSGKKKYQLKYTVIDPSGEVVALKSQGGSVGASSGKTVASQLKIPDPVLWDIGQGNLYVLRTDIQMNGRTVDSTETRFGIRTIATDPQKGFFLNGRSITIKGVCLHHDAGLVGAAVPKGVWKRRLQTLVDGGSNAVRISHQPGSREFMELCDEMGILAQVEFYDEWDNPKDKRLNCFEQHDDYISRGSAEYFQEWAEADLKNTMLRDRNHPSVIMWSIGNEIEWTYPRYRQTTGYFDANASGNYFWQVPPISNEEIGKRFEEIPEDKYVLARTAKKLADWTRELDTTRPVVANMIFPSASHESGYTDALDIVGYSYRRVMYDYSHERYPDKMIMGTENLVQWHEWKAVEERDFIPGTFLWTGISYMGEVHNGWPAKANSSGMLDVAAFEKPPFHMMKTLWTDEPHVFICSQTADKSLYRVDENGKVVEKEPGAWERRLWYWHDVNEHWNYSDGDELIVEVYSNCPEVELFLNDRSLGIKKLADFEDRIMRWAVPYSEGELKAVGISSGNVVTDSIVTHGNVQGIELDLEKAVIAADGYDVVHVVAQLMDKKGNPVLSEEQEIEFNVEGPCAILGVDNGYEKNVSDYQSNKVITHKGRCLLILQSLKQPGEIRITAKSAGVESKTGVVIAQ